MEEKNQKTVVAFIAGLLIGGLLVWVFSIAPDKKNEGDLKSSDTKTEETTTGEGSQGEMEGGEAADKGGDKGGDMGSTASPTVVANGSGSITVEDQKAGVTVALGAVAMPIQNGWIVIHELRDGALGNILGAARYAEADGLKPTTVYLLRGTEAGKTYKAVVYSENGDRVFDKSDDVPVKTEGGSMIEDSFVAN